MSQKTFSLAAAPIFAVIALLHLLRLVLGWDAMIGGWAVPTWLSWVALVIAASLAYQGFRLRKSR